MAIQISDNIASASRTANLDAKFGPYTSKQAVIDELVSDGSNILAVNGLTVGVIENNNVVEYVFKNVPANPTAANVTVNNLFLKQVAVQEETDPTVPAWAKAETKPSYTASEVGAIPDGDKGVANGVATLGSDGKVPQAQLPSYVDDVLEYSNQSSFPATGESGKIYVALDTNKTYRWSGSAYVEISQSLALGETSSTAFAGDRGKAIEDKIPSNASSSNKMVTASDLNGKVAKVANAQENNFASFDSDGGLQDSGCNEDTFIKGVKQNGTPIQPVDGVVDVTVQDGASAYEIWLEENGYTSEDYSEEDFLNSLKAQIGAFVYQDYDANTGVTNIGDVVVGSGNNGQINSLAPSQDTLDKIVLMPNNDSVLGSGDPTATMMFSTNEVAGTPPTYQFVYIGDVHVDPSTFVLKSDIDNNFAGGIGKVAGADEVLKLSNVQRSSFFVGKNNTLSTINLYGLKTERKYKVSLPIQNWDTSNVTTTGVNKFTIGYYDDEDAYHSLKEVPLTSDVSPYYYVLIPSNAKCLRVGGRANGGLVVYFNISEVSIFNDVSLVSSSSVYHYINYNTIDSTIVIPDQIAAIYNDPKSTTYRKVLSQTNNPVTLQIPSSSSNKYLIGWNESNGYYIKDYTSANLFEEDDIIIAVFTKAGYNSVFVTELPWSINRLPYGNNLAYGTLAGIPSGLNKYVNFNSLTNEITVPKDIILLSYGIGTASNTIESYTLPNTVTISIPSSGSSAKKILFDIGTRTFSVKDYFNSTLGTTNNTTSYRLFATLRTGNNLQFNCILPWSIDGSPYGIKVNQIKGFTKSINHRGYNVDAPENTLPAFKQSAAHNFDFIETDIMFTSDNIPVLIHNVTINDTARNDDGTELDGDVYVSQTTYEQLLSYDFGIWKSQSYAGTKIPTLEEAVQLCRNLGIGMYLELKTGSQSKMTNCYNIVKNNGMLNKVVWISFSAELLGYIKSIDSNAHLGLLTETVNQTKIDLAIGLKTNTNYVFINTSDRTPEAISLCKQNNLPMETYLINSASALQTLDGYISGVTSDSLNANIGLYNIYI